jgi:NADPH:quinone reductase-like Zn-dependent oxidoreductase
MKAVILDRFGDPAEVLQVRDIPVPTPKPGQVRVRMLASPINPSDLLSIQGQYGKLPRLPMTPGFEGAGIVEESGGGLMGKLVLGKRVAVINGVGGTWAEHTVIPARQAIMVPKDLPTEQIAGYFVNPATVILMVNKVLKVPRGAWLLQTAAASALGKMVIKLGKYQGFRTLNVVRRKDAAEGLLQLGGDAVINTSAEDLEDRVRQLTNGAGVKYALDAVGGPTGSAVVRTLAPGGRMLVYGTLSFEPLSIDPRVLIAGGKIVEGFWLAEWARQQNPLRMLALFRQVGKLMRAGVLTAEIGDRFGLDEIQTAVRRAVEPGRTGKVLLRIGT